MHKTHAAYLTYQRDWQRRRFNRLPRDPAVNQVKRTRLKEMLGNPPFRVYDAAKVLGVSAKTVYTWLAEMRKRNI